jgi:hypothetical protein
MVAYVESSKEGDMVYFTTHKTLFTRFEGDSTLLIISHCQYIQVQFRFNLKCNTIHFW